MRNERAAKARRNWPRRAGALTLALLALCTPARAEAQAFCPESVIKLIVPFPAGGPVDSTARIISEPLREVLEQTVILETRTGASGTTATAFVAQQPGNGCTVLLSYDTHGVNPALFDNLPYDTLTAFKPVTLLGTIPNVLAAHPSTPWKALEELVAAARGKDDEFAYATGGNGTIAHLTMKRIEQIYDIRMRHVPYRGAAPAVQDTLGGHVPMMMGSVLALGPATRDGRLRALVQTGARRHPLLPETPTLSERVERGFEAVSWIGVFLPASAPDALATRLNGALRDVLAKPDVKQRLAALGVEIVASSPAELQAFVENEVRRWSEVARRYNVKAE
jgi:tripartite-type tricarboxylate transporter receptor subunit TctC